MKLVLLFSLLLLLIAGAHRADAALGDGPTFNQAQAEAKCNSDYGALKNAMLRVYGRVIYVTEGGLAHLNPLFKEGTWGEIDHMIIGTNEETRTMDVLLFKCSKLVKSWVKMSVEDFDDAQKTWQIRQDEIMYWAVPQGGPKADPSETRRDFEKPEGGWEV